MSHTSVPPKKVDVLPKVKRRKTQVNATTPSVPCELTEAVKTRNVVITTIILESYDDASSDLAEKLLHQVFHNANGDVEVQNAIIEILGLLLDFPVNVNVKNSEGKTVLHLAVENRMIQVTKFLISRGAEPVSADELLYHVFHNVDGNLELQTKIIGIFNLLLNYPVNLNIKNDAGHTILHLAIENRMTQVIEFLISRGANPKVRDNYHNSLLQFSIKNELQKLKNHSELENADEKRSLIEQSLGFVEWMVRQNLSSDFIGNNDKSLLTTLYLAIEHRMKDLIDFLTICGVNWRNPDGSTVLHFLIASEFRKFKTLHVQDRSVIKLWQEGIFFTNWMVSKKPEYIDCKNQDGDTPLHLAIKCKLLLFLLPLLRHTRDVTIVDNSGRTAFQLFADFIVHATPIGCCKLSEKICDVFLRKGYSVDVSDIYDNTPIHYMLYGPKRGCAKMMLEYSKNVDARDSKRNTALNLIMNYDSSDEFCEIDEKLVRILLAKGANVHRLNEDDISPLTAAVKNKKLNILRIFKEHGEDFCYSYGGGTLLHRFVESNVQVNFEIDESILDLLVNEGCQVNVKDEIGATSLYYAVQDGKSEIAEKLIKSGAFVNHQESSGGLSPLHVAVEQNRSNLLTLLIENGADVNARTFRGRTALHFDSKEDVAKILIENGAWIDVTDNNDYLPLQTAILHRNSRVIEDLIEYGADINDNAHVLRKKDYLLASVWIVPHLIKLRAAGLPIDEKLECVFFLGPGYNNFDEIHKDCLIEVEALKNYKIDNRRSLYDFLHMKRNYMCAHVKSKKLEELIESPMFPRDFLMYRTLISSAYRMAEKRRTMLGPAKEAWLELTGIRLPDLCLHEIFNHVSNVTLRSMIEGVKNQKV